MRREKVWAAAVAAGSILLPASLGWAGAPAPGRFTITRTLPDGRTEVRSVTLDELKAMTGPAAPAATAARSASPDSVVFALPAPVPDPVPASAVAAVLEPKPAEAAEPAVRAPPSPRSPSAAAIRAAAAARSGSTVHAPLALSGGWTLAAVRSDGDDDRASLSGDRFGGGAAKPRKGEKSALAVRDGRSFGQQGRFYLYAGTKNRGVGLNLTDHNGAESGGWGSDGVSYDKGGFSGQRSAGVGWRQGDVSTSLGWVHEKNNIKNMWGAPAEKDDRVALTFSWRPSAK